MPARLFVINQVAGPLTLQLLQDLSAAGVECELLTGFLDAEEGGSVPFKIVPGRTLAKAPAWKRLWTWLRFTVQAAAAAIRRRRVPMLVVTNPPWTMLVMPLLKALLGCRYVLLVYDIYPDVLERMGSLRRGGVIAGIWRRMSRRSLLAAEGVITIGERMAGTLQGHLRPLDSRPVEVMPNWADTDIIRPRPRSENEFALRHGLADKFVVMYSGSFGATHDTQSILRAAGMLTDLEDVRIVLIGGGTRQREVAGLVAESGLPNVILLPLQPPGTLPLSLSSAQCAIVSLDEGYEGVSVPSKTYYALAAGAALLAVSPPDTELTDLVARHGCGVHVPPRDPEQLAQGIRRFHDDPEMLERCRAAARAAAESCYSRRRIVPRYVAYLAARLTVARRIAET